LKQLWKIKWRHLGNDERLQVLAVDHALQSAEQTDDGEIIIIIIVYYARSST